MEDSSLSKIKDIRISLDLEVVYVLDSGLGQTLRMELASGNCRSLGKEVSSQHFNRKSFVNYY